MPAATALLADDESLSQNAPLDVASPVSSALRNAIPANALEIADWVRACESDGRGDGALRVLARTKQPAAGRNFIVVIGCEFAVLTMVVLIYAVFVLPQLDATFRGYGAALPVYTHAVFVLVTLLAPMMAAGVMLFVVGLFWRFLPAVFGPMLLPLDRIVLALPVIGPAIRGQNSVAMAGWLGFAPADEAARRTGAAAARVWSRGMLSRICTRALAKNQGGGIAAHLVESRGFDRSFIAAAALADQDEACKALRALWRTAGDSGDATEPPWIVPLHIVLGILVAQLVIAMYLPIFRLGILN